MDEAPVQGDAEVGLVRSLEDIVLEALACVTPNPIRFAGRVLLPIQVSCFMNCFGPLGAVSAR